MVSNYLPIQSQEVHAFLHRLLDSPENFLDSKYCTCSESVTFLGQLKISKFAATLHAESKFKPIQRRLQSIPYHTSELLILSDSLILIHILFSHGDRRTNGETQCPFKFLKCKIRTKFVKHCFCHLVPSCFGFSCRSVSVSV